MKSVMNHDFSRIPAPELQRSAFNRSCGYKTTFDSGDLIPFFLDEILPGDTMRLTSTIFARLATLIFPIMDNVFVDAFFFFVPNRLLWQNWEKFQGARTNPTDSTDYMIPVVRDAEDTSFGELSLADYFGIPTQVSFAVGDEPNALPFRAYNLIWNEWFRDQNLQPSINVSVDDGPDPTSDYTLRLRGKRHDYFTSCLPWPQKGDSVMLPLGVSAPVIGNATTIGFRDGDQLMGLSSESGSTTLRWSTGGYGDPVGSVATPVAAPNDSTTWGLTLDPANSGMIADLTAATAATVNQLRQAFQFQKILERDARGGTRYVEMLKAHFGVTSPDFRMQRPEYLGGCSKRVQVTQVAQTSESDTTPQGNLSAYGQIASNCGFNKSFVEHGYVIGLVNVRSDITYQQQLHKMWSRQTRFDFYMPALAHLGEQAVLNKEIFYPNLGTGGNSVFGYQERWAEYRYKPSMVTGRFRSNATVSLDAWHLATEFAAIPPLNSDFIRDGDVKTNIDRVISVPSEPQIIMDVYHDIKHARVMPVYSVPGQIDRF